MNILKSMMRGTDEGVQLTGGEGPQGHPVDGKETITKETSTTKYEVQLRTNLSIGRISETVETENEN